MGHGRTTPLPSPVKSASRKLMAHYLAVHALTRIPVLCYRAPNIRRKYWNKGAAMRKPFCNSHETREDFRKATYAPYDSGASRRKFLKALAAAGASAVLPSTGLLGQTSSGVSHVVPGRID